MGSIKTTIYLFSLLLLLAIVVLSCSKKDLSVNSSDNFLFGTSYGNCSGDCDQYYAIRDGKIYPTSGEYFPGPVIISNSRLSDQKYELAKKLIDNLPPYLDQQPNETFGCPDCRDQGGIHIEYTRGGGMPSIRKWHIDTDTSAIPVEIRQYAIQVINTIAQMEKY